MNTVLKLSAEEGHEAIIRLFPTALTVETKTCSTTDAHTARAAAEFHRHAGIVPLLQHFESRQPAIASPLADPLLARNTIDDEGSDSSGSPYYFDVMLLLQI
jgi:hypothetical protein